MIKSRILRWAGHVGRMGEFRKAFKMLTVKLTGKRLLGRPRRRWEGNIKIDLKKVENGAEIWRNFETDKTFLVLL